ncbi:MAG: [protein-PII] uridylyltransferase [Alphaproteobacteria bacterium]|nr:[protein-PII] uridylyltransferase [Alphaproteobacteria bacterium]
MQRALTSALKDLRNNRISGLEFCHRHSRAMDKHIKSLTSHIPQDIAIIATGGYGREELCPYSDIDLLFLTSNKTPKTLNDDIEKFLYQIWDSGIKIGHSVRTIKECITVSQEDPKVLSSLLDARIISGDKNLFQDFETELEKSLKPRTKKAYVEGKLDERDARHMRLGDSRYVLEPTIKDGKGGLRDYQTLFWIARVIYNAPTPKTLKDLKIITSKEQQRFEKDYEFLLTVRCHLHDIAGRGEERLHFDIQPQLAQRLNYQHRNNAKSVERFMKHYFLVTKDIGDLTRILVAAIEEEEEQKNRLVPQRAKSFLGFETINNRLNFAPNQKLKDDPINILRFFRVAQEADIDIHPKALQKIRRNIKLIDNMLCHNHTANALFLEILTDDKNAALTLRRMNEAGVLERFIPEFQKIKGLMQFDRYHVYTVDEHTLNAVDIMHKLESGALKEQAPLASTLIQTIENRKTLYVAILLHDICKGRENKKMGQDHSTLGAELALKLAPRLQLSDQGTRLVSWLIFDHLFMSEIAFKRDLEDSKTLEDFLFRIHDIERLKLLTILTTCDIMAVGPDRWTSWKDSLLTELYILAEDRLSGKKPQQKSKPEATPDLGDEKAVITFTQDDTKNATTLRIITQDKIGLFATLSGALAAANVNIIEARINTHDGGIAEDIFTIQSASHQQITKQFRCEEIKKSILAALDDNTDLEKKVAKTVKKPKTKELVFDIPEGVVINNNASKDATYIEIYGRDRQGFLFNVAQTLSKQNLIIAHAKVGTLGLKAVDIFYVTTLKGKKVTDEKRLKTLKKLLLETAKTP